MVQWSATANLKLQNLRKWQIHKIHEIQTTQKLVLGG